ncbi:MAG: hypothetical protein AAF676_02575 [Pseudomonadota bacterium]
MPHDDARSKEGQRRRRRASALAAGALIAALLSLPTGGANPASAEDAPEALGGLAARDEGVDGSLSAG